MPTGPWDLRHTRLMSPLPEILGELAWDSALWTLLGLGALIVVLLIGDWLYGWWITTLLRNRVEAKRRLRREGREAK